MLTDLFLIALPALVVLALLGLDRAVTPNPVAGEEDS